ncbi:Integrator complex subunit 4 [Homalodisca vitripennis]|nr:Integrator complex subunit 4 [Homalodisca vitripennis]
MLLKRETSHHVRAQGLATLLRLCKLMPDNIATHHKLILLAKQYLNDTSHLVKQKALDVLGELLPVGQQTEASLQTTVRLISDYAQSQDARVRSTAFNTLIVLHGRGLKLQASLYDETCEALKDDYEIVRRAALQLIYLLAKSYPDHPAKLADSDEELRLVDDAFGKICNAVNDLSMRVRTQAAQLLGSLTLVSPKFLHQTLDKKLFSNMRKKRSAHERAWESVTSGEWSSGKKWADDAPQEMLDAHQINLISSGSCGAFVHGLEDEFLEVRSASVDSICSLSLNNPQFANLALDFLVDMFNDEIEDVRIKAIDSLTKISRHTVLREDQLETILGALEDVSMDVREGLHRMLASCSLSTKGCLQMCVESLLDNLKKYPQDKKSTWRCMQRIGSRHPELTLPLVPELLSIHPFFDTAEADVEDPAYICILMLVFNAAQHCPTMLQLFEETTVKHYGYLRDTMPQLVPPLKLGALMTTELATLPSSTPQFLTTLLSRLEGAPNARVHMELLLAAERDLNRLATIDDSVSGAAQFTALYITSQLLMSKVLADKMWCSNAANALQGNSIKNSIIQLLQHCFKLQHLFTGLRSADKATVKQFKLKTLALQLVHVVRASNHSALALCQHFLAQGEHRLHSSDTCSVFSGVSLQDCCGRYIQYNFFPYHLEIFVNPVSLDHQLSPFQLLHWSWSSATGALSRRQLKLSSQLLLSGSGSGRHLPPPLPRTGARPTLILGLGPPLAFWLCCGASSSDDDSYKLGVGARWKLPLGLGLPCPDVDGYGSKSGSASVSSTLSLSPSKDELLLLVVSS